MICCYQVTKIFSTRYGSAIASSARGPCNFSPLTDLAISVFREVNTNTVLTQILTSLCSEDQELQKEVNCMNDFKDFQDAESIRSGNSHVTSRPVSFPPHPIPEGMLSILSYRRAAEKGRQA